MTVNCILVVGSTGTGKSTTISLCSGVPVATSNSTDECTLDITSFQHGDEAWIDTIGFDGTDTDRSDDEAFQHILRFLQDQGRTHVKAVIWTVKPDIRESATLQSQASLINKFKEGRVWDNVIIVVKEPGPDVLRNSAGAKAAALKYCGDSTVQTILGYALKDSLPEDQQANYNRMKAEDRAFLNVLTNEEMKMKLRNAISSLPEPFQVVFRNAHCLDCGVVADLRLLPSECHLIREQVHRSPPAPFHPLLAIPRHPTPVPALRHPEPIQSTSSNKGDSKLSFDKALPLVTAAVTPLVNPVVAGVALVGTALGSIFGGQKTEVVVSTSTWKCCGKAPDAEGCESYWPCCGETVGHSGCVMVYQCCKGQGSGGQETGCGRRYPCCAGEEGSNGCLERCAYCHVQWGQQNKNCVGKTHQNVVNIG